MRNPIGLKAAIFSSLAVCFAMLGTLRGAQYQIADKLPIDQVPSWFPVQFCLLTHDEVQYVAYYNADHQMMVAQRDLSQREWKKVELPSKVGWDSHNYITMAVDHAGHIHLAGNMHVDPLVYFRTRIPGDITTFKRQEMIGRDETACTYPRFLRSNGEELLFCYRDGGSGNGRRLINRYSVSSKTWSRLIHTPIFDGRGEMSAYPLGPRKGPDGMFHTVWVWRDTPDCATNHHLSYARSTNLKDWENAAGEPLQLPLTIEQDSAWVDPIPAGGGIINGCESLAFDSRNRPIIAYHKSDKRGFMQIFVARFQDGRWQRHPLTDWKKEVPFSGRGAMPFIGIKISKLQKTLRGNFYIKYRHRDYGSGRITLDEESLQPIDSDTPIPQKLPSKLMQADISFEGIGVRIRPDSGTSPTPQTKYVLRWETLDANHDRPRAPPLPPASELTLVQLERVN